MRKLPITTALFLALAPTAFAQRASTDEIVVTATGAPVSARDLPARVIVIEADSALSRGEPTLADALRAAPGLGVVASGGAGQQTSLFAGGANSNHTLVLLDGIRINDPSTPGSSFDAGQDQLGGLSRIEIVEGPMSAVFGSDAIGGVVNMLPRHGGAGPINARMDLSGGSFDTATATAGLDGTLGGFRYALTGDGYRTGGFDITPERMSTHSGERDGAKMASLTGAFDLALGQRFALDLLAKHRRAQADFDLFDGFTDQRLEDSTLQISRNDLTLARLGATWRPLEGLSVRATYGGLEDSRAQKYLGAITDTFVGERRFGELSLAWRAEGAGPFDTANIRAGLTRETEKADIAQGFGFAPPFFFTSGTQDHDGAYLTAQGRIGAVSATLAVRVDDYESFDTQTTWRAGATYDVTPFARIYAAYGAAFRAPTLYERFVSFGNPNLKPEEGESWEVGADAHMPAFGQERGLEVELTYRRSEISNLIDFNAFFAYANVDKAEVETAEARIAARPLSWLTADLSYVRTDAEDVDAHVDLPRRPKDAWAASLAVARGSFEARLAWRQIGERSDRLYGDDGFPLGQGVQPAYDVVRASAAYEFQPGMQAYVAVDNLLDETYEPVNAFAGAERNVMLGIRLRTGG